MSEKLPLVSIITVNYNGKRLLDDCFASLAKLDYPKDKIEIFMIDNGSTDQSVEYVRKHFPRVKIIKNQENNYARANNLGIKSAKGEYVALVNNDIKLDKEWLVSLVKCMRHDKQAGVVGSKILFMDGAVQSVGHKEYPNFYWVDIGFREQDGEKYQEKKEVASVCGCSALYRKKCLRDVGLLDEDFNMFMEDVDMAIRSRKKGWKVISCPESVVYHKFHSTIKTEEGARYWQEKNRLLLIAKYWPKKLPEALFGKGYFSFPGSQGVENIRDISEILGAVFVKLIKEHGLETAMHLSPDIFKAVQKIYNFEKDQLINEVKNKVIELSEKDKQVIAKDHELAERGKTIIQKDHELAKLIQQFSSFKEQKINELLGKEQKIISQERQLHSFEQDIGAREQDILERDKQVIAKDLELAERDKQIIAKDLELAERDKQIIAKGLELNEKIALKDHELADLIQQFIPLREHSRQLINIYNSTGYRYLLKPLWDISWVVKRLLRRAKGILSKKVDTFGGVQTLPFRAGKDYAALSINPEQTTGTSLWCRRIDLQVPLRKIKNMLSGPLKLKCGSGNKITTLLISRFYRSRNPWLNIYYSHLKKKTIPPLPHTVVLMLTKRCNLSCKFCDIKNSNEEMPTADAIKVIDNFKNLKLSSLVITGGEPLLHEGVFDVAARAREMGIKVCITTNGSLISENIDKIYNAGVSVLSVSLDGLGPIHDELRGGRKGLFKQVSDNILKLKKDAKVEAVAINFVLTKRNIDDLDLVYEWAKKNKIFFDFWPVNNHNELNIGLEGDYAKFLKFLRKLKNERHYPRSAHSYYTRVPLYINNSRNLKVRCLALAKDLGVNVNGGITPCCVWNRSTVDLGNAIYDDMESLWHSSKYWEIRNCIYSEGCSERCYNVSLREFMGITGEDFIVKNRKGRGGSVK